MIRGSAPKREVELHDAVSAEFSIYGLASFGVLSNSLGESLDPALACGIYLTELDEVPDLRSTGGSLNEQE